MDFRAGYELKYRFTDPTPVISMLNVHYSRVSDLQVPDHLALTPSVEMTGYRDNFGNWCTRFVAPAGAFRMFSDFVIRDSGLPDATTVDARQTPVEELPVDALVYLLPSRFCDSDRLQDLAWQLFGSATPGAGRVRAVCDFAHRHIEFGYHHARVSRTATESYNEGRGVCRDYAHLAIAFCRALNIPARYCTGYLSDVGTPPPLPAGDFAAWFEAYLDNKWYIFDPRNNEPRIGRFLIARGRDAADVAITTTFGPNILEGFRVWTDEIPGGATSAVNPG